MLIRWYGHACFQLVNQSGLRILTDPFDESIGYLSPPLTDEIVTVSHSHFDHAAVDRLQGTPRILRNDSIYQIGAVQVRGISTFHDDFRGKRRGANVMFHFTIDGIRILHCGDLGHLLYPQQILQTGPVDILLLPTGGSLSLEPDMAKKVCDQLKPKVIIPMHYKTAALNFPLLPVEPFIQQFPVDKVYRKDSVIELNVSDLPLEQEVWVLNYL
ncbi:MAG TPA: MBL fold metallo-hydrolase [Bacillota bacterium]|nr:MBL fold metallo-hydrolase [Bacillota bacterium]